MALANWAVSIPLPGILLPFFTIVTLLFLDPRWAIPIKVRVREANQARAINEVVNALKQDHVYLANAEDAPLRVVNGISTQSSSMITVAARENVRLSATDGMPGRPGNSSIVWAGGLAAHPEQELEDEPVQKHSEDKRPPPEPKILYFPLFRHLPSREQRRLAMEKDMLSMGLPERRKDDLRARWRQNETDYLREQRRKVDVSAFVKLKTIGHGECAAGSLDCFKTPKLPHARCIWRRVSCERTNLWQVVCYEAGACLPR